MPSVAWCAGELNLSANYFDDLIKKETGKSAHEFIQLKLIDAAKGKIFDKNKSILGQEKKVRKLHDVNLSGFPDK